MKTVIEDSDPILNQVQGGTSGSFPNEELQVTGTLLEGVAKDLHLIAGDTSPTNPIGDKPTVPKPKQT